MDTLNGALIINATDKNTEEVSSLAGQADWFIFNGSAAVWL